MAEEGSRTRAGMLMMGMDPTGGHKPMSVGSDGGLTQSTSPLPAGTNRAGTVTNAGQAIELAPANTNRKGLKGQNTSASAVLRMSEITGVDPSSTVGYVINPGGSFSVNTSGQVKMWSSVAGASWEATEWN